MYKRHKIDDRIENIHQLLIEYAKGNFNFVVEDSGAEDDIDILIIGLRMLGEELARRELEVELANARQKANSVEKKYVRERISLLLNSVNSVASGKCDVLNDISENNDDFDALAMGINMMIDDIVKGRETEQENERINQLNAQLREAKEKAEESDRLKSAFLSTMSHELRTPLNAIIGFSDLINKDISLDETVDYAEMINNSGHHLLKLIEDMFSLTLIESGQVAVRNEYFELAPFLSDIWDVIKEEQQKMGKQELTLIFYPHLVIDNQQVNTDKIKLKQILISLLNNALKFTKEGLVEFVCLAEFAGDKSLLRFYVKDTGIGIKEEDQKIIFDPFRQISNSYSRQAEGTGIGLTVSQRLSRLLGGSISVQSVIDKGTTFTFTLPLHSQESVSSKAKMPKMNWGGRTILVAEDDSSNFELIKTFLRPTGISIIHAVNGKEAVDLCKNHTDIDLILMDRRMPVMDGFVATKIIKENNPDIPVIALTALTMLGDRETALAFGCDDFILKPINVDILYRVVNRYLMKMVEV